MSRFTQLSALRPASYLPTISAPTARGAVQMRAVSTNHSEVPPREADKNSAKAETPDQSEAPVTKQKKTQAQLDEEMRLKLEEFSGEGGAAGMEFENGKAVSMKRGVRDNMFRYI
ncbi:hypothetical protein MMC34_005389 [Xylographa carneopallida]|nr:hypothetical protein [Xylographa carneopallida]